MYVYPVLEDGELLMNRGTDFLVKWNEYAYLRLDVNRIDKASFLACTEAEHYKLMYGVSAADAVRYDLDVTKAILCPARKCVKAYAVLPSENARGPLEGFRFALDYINKKRLTVCYDPLLFLPSLKAAKSTFSC